MFFTLMIINAFDPIFSPSQKGTWDVETTTTYDYYLGKSGVPALFYMFSTQQQLGNQPLTIFLPSPLSGKC